MGKTLDQVTEWQIRTARTELPRFLAFAQDLDQFVQFVFASPVPWTGIEDSAATMALSFTTKQLEHLRSVRVLIDAGMYRDSHLIARTMLEARGTLQWAFKDRPAQTDKWLRYGFILDWRQMIKNKEDGIDVDEEAEATCKRHVDKYGKDYLRWDVRDAMKKAEQSGTVYNSRADPWLHGKWTEVDVAARFKAIGDERYYDSFYRRTSEWMHSGPRALLDAVNSAEAVESEVWRLELFNDDDVVAGVWGLGVACDSLIKCLEVLDNLLSLGHAESIDEASSRLWSIMESSLASHP